MADLTQEFLADTTHKKRKVDKDGFVCPSLSDIPRSSHQYGDDQNYSSLDSFDSLSSGDHTLSSYFNPSDQRDVLSDQQLAPTPQGDAGTSEGKPGNALQSLLNEFTNEFINTVNDWNPMLRQSLDFEADCSEKLDGLLGVARDLESSLSTQRNVLYQRLRGIGQTLSQED